jgi:hypothetical protein
MDRSEPPALEDLYDEDILARIDRVLAPAAPVGEAETPVDEPPPVVPRYPVARRMGVSGAMLAGSMAGLGEVLEPERARQHVIEFAPDKPDEHDQLVTFHYVPGDPKASRIVVRPWLLERFLARRADR